MYSEIIRHFRSFKLEYGGLFRRLKLTVIQTIDGFKKKQ